MNGDAETFALLAAGKLEQTCQICGRSEAAGYYCTACGRSTGPADWRRGEATDAQRAALTAARRRRHPDAPPPTGNASPLAESGRP